MTEIIFATKNQGKLKEIKAVLGDKYEVKSMEEIGINIDIVEDGTTFEENAIKKAVAIMKLSNKIVLSDDSGMEIDYLDGKPGVLSARFLGEDTAPEVKNEKVIEMLREAKEGERGAKFVSVIALAMKDQKPITIRGELAGEITKEPVGVNGFGYDPIFFIPEFNKTTAELSPEEKNKISHRGKALLGIKNKLDEILKNI